MKENYDASSIQILEGLEAVRKRPGMYIGPTDRNGLHHLIFEISDNSVDEALAGYCSQIDITFHPEDNSIEISDNGRGIPVDIHPQKGISAATIIYTVLHAGGKFGGENSSYKVSGGLHGVGATVANALSRYLELTIRKNGKVYFQRFEKGQPVEVLKVIRDMEPNESTGTSVRFSPDPEIFRDAMEEKDGINLSADYIRERLKRTAYLTKKLKFNLIDENGVKTEYYSENGIIDLVADQSELIQEKEKINYEEDDNIIEPNFFPEPFFYEGVWKNPETNVESSVEVSFNYVNKFFKTNLLTFANNIFTELGGTHLKGFETGIQKVLTDYAVKNMDIKNLFTIEDILEGINLAISFKTEEPSFTTQTKNKLSTSDARKLLFNLTKEYLEEYLDKNPQTAQAWINKILQTQRLRENFEKAQIKARKEGTIQGLSGTPAKLADCRSKIAEECELYLVEGDSAGGSAKQARNKMTQAILPLKGKILNISKITDVKRMLESEEIRNLITTLRCGHGDEFNYSKLRYHKVFIMTDADVDGAHIATLFCNFFLQEMPELVKNGHLYLAMPPLYVVKKKSENIYYSDKEALDNDYPNGAPNSIQRFKGLGEMNPDQLWETTMNPKTRKYMQIRFDETRSEVIYKVFEDLMGSEVENRKQFIMANAKKADLDI